jgi:hypothetical protein
MFELTFETDNAGFHNDDDTPNVCEVARILRHVASLIESESVIDVYAGTVRDINGNTVGIFEYRPYTNSQQL